MDPAIEYVNPSIEPESDGVAPRSARQSSRSSMDGRSGRRSPSDSPPQETMSWWFCAIGLADAAAESKSKAGVGAVDPARWESPALRVVPRTDRGLDAAGLSE